MSFSLIVPVASNKSEYERTIPPMFQLADTGIVLCIEAIRGMDLSLFDHIYFTILGSLDKKYYLSEMLKLQFKINGISNAEVVVLDEETHSQPETVYQTIIQKKISGSIYIKDADSYFSGELISQNSIAIYPLESLNWVNPKDKSYVAIDDMFYITNIIEKKIIGHYFSAGGYCFEDAAQFCCYFLKYRNAEKMYLSHLVYAMLLDKHIFRPQFIKCYKDLNEKYEIVKH